MEYSEYFERCHQPALEYANWSPDTTTVAVLDPLDRRVRPDGLAGMATAS